MRNHSNPGRLWKNIWKCRQLYLIILLPLASVILFSYVPMYGLQLAFKTYSPAKGITGSPWVGLKHFISFFQAYDFKAIIKNTLSISTLSILCGPPLALLFALMLNTVRNLRLKKVIQTVTYAPHFISIIVLVGMINLFFSPVAGAYGSIYKLLHNGEMAPMIMGLERTFVPTYILSGIWQGLGWGSIIYVAALSSVDQELHEAALIDGASRLSRIRHIDIPAIIPTISITVILAFGGIMSVGFDKAYLMQAPLNLSVSEVISTHIYKRGLLGGFTGFSYGTAVGFFNNLVNCIMLVIANFSVRLIGGRESTSLF